MIIISTNKIIKKSTENYMKKKANNQVFIFCKSETVQTGCCPQVVITCYSMYRSFSFQAEVKSNIMTKIEAEVRNSFL